MTPPHLLVVQHNLDDSLNELAVPLVEAGLHIDTWATWLGDEPPSPAASYDGVLSLGGLDSAADEPRLPWVAAERALLAEALDLGLPVLGVCFGAQILARAAGGRSHPATRSEIGWCPVDLEPAASDDLLLSAFPSRFHAFQYHYDTVDLPEGAVVLGRNDELIQAYRIGDRAWGLQFHIEANPGLVYAWLGTYRADMDKANVDIDDLRSFTASYYPQYRELTWAVGAAFAAVLTASTAEG
jgi:GMP synthase (glutamine-hydrolysing)